VIFGGEHADMPIGDSAGSVIGKFVAEGNYRSFHLHKGRHGRVVRQAPQMLVSARVPLRPDTSRSAG
jgi:hypothetical protein